MPYSEPSTYCSVLKGASEIYVVDNIPERLEKAEDLGAVAIDFSKGDPVEQIFALRKAYDKFDKRIEGIRRF